VTDVRPSMFVRVPRTCCTHEGGVYLEYILLLCQIQVQCIFPVHKCAACLALLTQQPVPGGVVGHHHTVLHVLYIYLLLLCQIKVHAQSCAYEKNIPYTHHTNSIAMGSVRACRRLLPVRPLFLFLIPCAPRAAACPWRRYYPYSSWER
jgi:hypothetical protein